MKTGFEINRLVGREVWMLRPLIEAYAEAVPTDPWADMTDHCLAWYQLVSENPTGVVLAADQGGIAGFCVAEVVRDRPNNTRCCMIYAAYAEPRIRSPLLRDVTLALLREHAREHRAGYLSTFAARGEVLARWLGRDWKYAGDHNGRAYLVGRLPEAVML